MTKNNSKVRGVTWESKFEKWRSRMNNKHIGYFEEFYAAVYARFDAERESGIIVDTDASQYIDRIEG